MAEQENLLDLPEQPPTPVDQAEPTRECKLRPIQRDQLTMAQIDVEHLIEEQHAARGIWEVAQGLDLSRYESAIRTRQGEVGRAAWPPQLLIAVRLYGYSQGITSARELVRNRENLFGSHGPSPRRCSSALRRRNAPSQEDRDSSRSKP
jgi:hypothetical protein